MTADHWQAAAGWCLYGISLAASAGIFARRMQQRPLERIKAAHREYYRQSRPMVTAVIKQGLTSKHDMPTEYGRLVKHRGARTRRR
jgi:hypothetical protein